MHWDVRDRRWACFAAIAAAVLGCGSADGPPVRVTIPTGATMRTAAESLHKAGVIGSTKSFLLYAKMRRLDRGIKAGTYMLHGDDSWRFVLSALHSGRGLVNTVTIPEGFTLGQIQPLLAAKLGVPADSIRAAVTDTALLHRLDVPTPTVEGYLFPDTYFFPPGTTARAAVLTMVRRFEQRWRPEWASRLDTLSLSRHDLLTLASIVEREAKRPEERPVIAAVYWNRLRKGMLLQADPTVQYALPEYQTRLLKKHLAVKSRYNTYKYPGLPPGPIASPGVSSMRATLYPANVPFLYFVAHPDGHHEFRVKLAEHNAAVRVARRAWDAVRKQQRLDSLKAAAPRRRVSASPRPGARERAQAARSRSASECGFSAPIPLSAPLGGWADSFRVAPSSVALA